MKFAPAEFSPEKRIRIPLKKLEGLERLKTLRPFWVEFDDKLKKVEFREMDFSSVGETWKVVVIFMAR